MSEEKKTYETKEKAEGVWAVSGENIKFTRIWAGHRFTDEEVAALLAGNEIAVSDLTNKSGQKYGAYLKLDNQTYNGRRFVGATFVRYIDNIPNSWCKHEFSAAEKTTLMAGNSVEIKNAVNSDGKKFSCNVRYGTRPDGKVGIYIDTSL